VGAGGDGVVPGGNGALVDRERFIGHDQVLGNLDFNAQPVALRAGSVRGIERKQTRLQLRKPYPAVGAGIAFAVGEFTRLRALGLLYGYQPLGIF